MPSNGPAPEGPKPLASPAPPPFHPREPTTDRKRHFIDTYVATFLASREAIRYEKWADPNADLPATTDQPILYAVFQALETWRLYEADKTLLEPRD